MNNGISKGVRHGKKKIATTANGGWFVRDGAEHGSILIDPEQFRRESAPLDKEGI